jgi:3-oxoacyl-[acyl-carrier-protein] synthase II
MANEREIAIVGAGVMSPAGRDLPEFWGALCGGRPQFTPYRHPEVPESVTVVVGEADAPDPGDLVSKAELLRLDRVHLLAIAAADAAMAGGVDRPEPERCAVVCGVGYGAAGALEALHRTVESEGVRGLSPFSVPLTMANSVSATLAMRYGFQGPCLTLSTACASGADAIGQGAELLRRGAADLVLAGGADAMISITTLLSFFRMGALSPSADPLTACRPFDRSRSGFVLGEGAGFVLLRRSAEVMARSAVLGRILGYAATCDAHHVVAPRADGAVVRRCAELALLDAGLRPSDIGHINAHGTATPQGDRAEAAAIRALFGGDGPPVTATKSITGHMIGGSGAVEAIATVLSLRDGLVPPTGGYAVPDPDVALDVVTGEPRKAPAPYAISNSFGFGGHNAVLVLGAA